MQFDIFRAHFFDLVLSLILSFSGVCCVVSSRFSLSTEYVMLDILADCSDTHKTIEFTLMRLRRCIWPIALNVQIVIRHEVLRFVNTVKATVLIWSNRCTIPLPNARLGCSPTIRTSIPSSGPPRTHHSPRASSSFIKSLNILASPVTSVNWPTRSSSAS